MSVCLHHTLLAHTKCMYKHACTGQPNVQIILNRSRPVLLYNCVAKLLNVNNNNERPTETSLKLWVWWEMGCNRNRSNVIIYTASESASAVHVYSHLSSLAHGAQDQCTVCVCDKHVCFSLSTQFPCCSYTVSLIHALLLISCSVMHLNWLHASVSLRLAPQCPAFH